VVGAGLPCDSILLFWYHPPSSGRAFRWDLSESSFRLPTILPPDVDLLPLELAEEEYGQIQKLQECEASHLVQYFLFILLS